MTESQQVHKHQFGQVKYLFPREDGICDVPDKLHIRRLLEMGDRYELAYERYGIHFNEDGREIKHETTSSLPAIQTTVSFSDALIPKLKMSIADRMAKARAARQAKKLNGAPA